MFDIGVFEIHGKFCNYVLRYGKTKIEENIYLCTYATNNFLISSFPMLVEIRNNRGICWSNTLKPNCNELPEICR